MAVSILVVYFRDRVPTAAQHDQRIAPTVSLDIEENSKLLSMVSTESIMTLALS